MKKFVFSTLIIISLFGCIGSDLVDDLVEPKIVIDNQPLSIKVGTDYQFEFKYFNNTGSEVDAEITWSSSDPSIMSITESGLAVAHKEGGVDITGTAADASIIFSIAVGNETVMLDQPRTAILNTTTSYKLTGTATLTKKENGFLLLSFSQDYDADTSLPGLYVYLSNSTSNVSNAVEVGPITKFSGEYSLNVPAGTDLYDYTYVFFYCKPFSVPVGNGELKP